MGASAQETPDIGLANVVSVATGDWTGDGRMDAALLVAPSDDDADSDFSLYIYARHEYREGVELALHVPDLVWGGRAMVGQEPYLSVSETGSLRVTSQNSSIGRDRWEETLTIARRDGAYVVAGYTYSWYDTLDPEANGGCDVNLLTGKGEKTVGDRTVRLSLGAQRIALADWKAGGDRDVCGVRE